MKKYAFSLVFSSIFSLCLAQRNQQPAPQTPHTPLQFGVYAGANTGAPIPKNVVEGSKGDLGTNFRGGLMTKYNFSEKFGLLVECGYAHKTATFSSPVKDQYIEQTFQVPDGQGGFITGKIETTFSGNTKGSFDLHYLESALLAEYNVNRHLSVAVGAFGADLVSGTNTGIATEVQIGTVPGFFPDQPFDNSAELNRFDYGLVGGLGYKLVDNLQLNMRLAWGSPSIYLPTFTRVPEPLPTRYLQVGMDYRIGERL
jgi:Outer membrane protein beta-barrel domain